MNRLKDNKGESAPELKVNESLFTYRGVSLPIDVVVAVLAYSNYNNVELGSLPLEEEMGNIIDELEKCGMSVPPEVQQFQKPKIRISQEIQELIYDYGAACAHHSPEIDKLRGRLIEKISKLEALKYKEN